MASLQHTACLMRAALTMLLIMNGSACSPANEQPGRGETASPGQQILKQGQAAEGGATRTADGFRRAIPGYRFAFPRDHAPHAGFRTEWWYYTGFLQGQKMESAFQFTIFKVEQSPVHSVLDAINGTSPALYIGHFALSERQGGPFAFREVHAREMPGMSGYHAGRREIFVRDAFLRLEGDASHRHHLAFRLGRKAFEMNLVADRPPIVHGRDGASQKTLRHTYSHYYSVVGLSGEGTVREDSSDVHGAAGSSSFRVSAWMDHEFASDVLSAEEPGWDWLHFTLNDGRRYMLFRVRGRASSQDYFSGAVISTSGQSTGLDGRSTIGPPRGRWRSPATGAIYPSGFHLSVDGMKLEAIPWREDAEIIAPVTGVNYWEGPVDIRGMDARTHRPVVGRGFLELTGYSSSMADRF